MTAEQLGTLGLAAGVSVASGLRVYATIAVLGLLDRADVLQLPPGLEALSHPAIITIAAALYLTEFVADKVPAIDSAWDAIHTFIRIPAGALLAAGATGDSLSALTVAAGLLGGTITAGTHFTKAGGRAVINTSPEPVSNWGASFTEDALVVAGIWLAFNHPLVFLLLLLLFLLMLVWLIPKVWRGIRAVVDRVSGPRQQLPPAGA